MKRAMIASLAFLSLLLVVSPPALAAAPETAASRSDSVTVGEFAIQVARLLATPTGAPAVLTPEQAIERLKESGWTFGGSPESTLTQAELASFLKQAGLQFTVPSPDQPLTQDQAKAALTGFGSYFASRGSSVAKGLGPTAPDGHTPLPSTFEQCAQLPTVGQCRECCFGLGLSNKSCGRACGRAHAALNVSANEPTP